MYTSNTAHQIDEVSGFNYVCVPTRQGFEGGRRRDGYFDNGTVRHDPRTTSTSLFELIYGRGSTVQQGEEQLDKKCHRHRLE